jgi:hypothetical protein
METLEEQIFPDWLEQLQSCPQEYPASRRVLPGSAEALAMSAGSGRQCSMLFDQSSPLGAFSKILLESSLWTNSEEYCYIWERLDTRFGLSAFQLTPLGPNTGDNGCSLLPTPRKEGYDSQGKGHGDLVYEVKNRLWPTPTERDWKSTSHGNQGNARPLSEVAGLYGSGSLNPRFCEELMGFPIDHTALKL